MADPPPPPAQDPPITSLDNATAYLARNALFPPRTNRDGTRPSFFPALDALTKVRDDAIAADDDRAPSSFFPSRVVVVHTVGSGKFGTGEREKLKWNGWPDIDPSAASFDVIPGMVLVRCMECAGLLGSSAVPSGRAAFTRATDNGGDAQLGDLGRGEKRREIVLCTDRVLKSDYDPERGVSDPPPPRLLAAVEEALAREFTVLRDHFQLDRIGGGKSSKESAAATEVLAAKAAECFFERHGSEVKKGSGLPVGYSLLPAPLRKWSMDRCVRITSGKSVKGGNLAE